MVISKRRYLSELLEIENHLGELAKLLGEGYYSSHELDDMYAEDIQHIQQCEGATTGYETQVGEIRRILHLYMGGQERRRELYIERRQIQDALGEVYNAIGGYYYVQKTPIGSYTIIEELLHAIDVIDETIEKSREELKVSSWKMMSRSLFLRLKQKKSHEEIRLGIDDYDEQREDFFQRLGEQICAANMLAKIVVDEKGKELQERYQENQKKWNRVQEHIERNNASIAMCLSQLSQHPVEEPFERSIQNILWLRDMQVEERLEYMGNLGLKIYERGLPDHLQDRHDLQELCEKIKNLKQRQSQVLQLLNSHNMLKEQQRLERMLEFNYEQLVVKDHQTQTLRREITQLERENRQIRKRITQIRTQLEE